MNSFPPRLTSKSYDDSGTETLPLANMQNKSLPDALSHLPETVQVIAGVIGLDATRQLIEAFGGSTFPISQGKTRLGQIRFAALAEVIGEHNAQTMAFHFHDERLYIPRCAAWLQQQRNANILSDFDRLTGKEGYSQREAVISLSMKYRLSDRHINTILKRSI